MGDLDHDTTPSGADGRYTVAISEGWRIRNPSRQPADDDTHA